MVACSMARLCPASDTPWGLLIAATKKCKREKDSARTEVVKCSGGVCRE